MTTSIKNQEAVIERTKRVKLAGEYKDFHVPHITHPCQIIDDGFPGRKFLIFQGVLDIKPEDWCVVGVDVYEISSVQSHEQNGTNETVAVGNLDQFESGMRKLTENGCDVRFGKIIATAKDHAADEFMDEWVGTFTKNIVAHYDEIKSGRHIGELFGLFNHDVPVVCVGAGPSLDKNAHLLYEFPGVIIATDKAYKMLKVRGIDPDVVISIDCHYDLVPEYLDCPGNNDNILVLNTCADPKVTKIWGGQIFWFLMRHPGVQFTDRILPALFPTFGSIENCGNVGNASVLLADHMGLSPIILIGQDYGYTGGKLSARRFEYSDGGKISEIKLDHERLLEERTGKLEVDGITTYAPFIGYRDTLYGLRERNSLNMINCTEGGILTGLPCAPFSSIIDGLSKDHRTKSEEAKNILKNFRR